jgi:hypothetical protein
MTGRKRRELSRGIRLASKFQTWRLNQLGRLAIVDKAEPISAEQAWGAIAAELRTLGLERFPGPGEAWLERPNSDSLVDEAVDGSGVEA